MLYPRTEAVLADAENPDGSRRFYPPGEHPATARYRGQLALLERDGHGESEMVDYIREQLAQFEMGEDRAKLEYLRRVLADERERIA